MSLDDYKASLAPKMRGTWNLHEKLSKEDLDFFIMLSSTAGIIGNASQAAYSAASTFLDAFADYRNNLGLPAVTIDLGMVSDVGYLAVNADLRHMLEKLGLSSVYLPELLAMIKTAIVHPLRSKVPPAAQSPVSVPTSSTAADPGSNIAFSRTSDAWP
jgi:hypothetical protein